MWICLHGVTPFFSCLTPGCGFLATVSSIAPSPDPTAPQPPPTPTHPLKPLVPSVTTLQLRGDPPFPPSNFTAQSNNNNKSELRNEIKGKIWGRAVKALVLIEYFMVRKSWGFLFICFFVVHILCTSAHLCFTSHPHASAHLWLHQVCVYLVYSKKNHSFSDMQCVHF